MRIKALSVRQRNDANIVTQTDKGTIILPLPVTSGRHRRSGIFRKENEDLNRNPQRIQFEDQWKFYVKMKKKRGDRRQNAESSSATIFFSPFHCCRCECQSVCLATIILPLPPTPFLCLSGRASLLQHKVFETKENLVYCEGTVSLPPFTYLRKF